MKLLPSGGLWKYLEVANEVSDKVQHLRGKEMDLLGQIDNFWHNKVLGGTITVDPIPSMPLVQSYFLWMAGVRVALSGHAIAAFPILRSSTEAACYSFRMSRSPALQDVWKNRDRSPQDTKSCRRAFTSCIKDTAADIVHAEPAISRLLTEMYDAAITFGAHPNAHFMFHHLRLGEETETDHILNFDCINDPESANTTRVICAAIEHGLMASYISMLACGTRPQDSELQAIYQFLHQQKNEAYLPGD